MIARHRVPGLSSTPFPATCDAKIREVAELGARNGRDGFRVQKSMGFEDG